MNTAERVTVPIECSAKAAEVIRTIVQLGDGSRVITSAEELDELESELREHANELYGHIVEQRIQHALDCEEVREAQRQLLESYPHRMQDKGKQEVRVRTGCGCEITVRTSYFSRKGKRWGKKRYAGLYPGLLVLGVHERCTPGLAAEISLLSGILGSLEEARKVLGERGVDLNIKTVRRIAYRFAERARMAQRIQGVDFGSGIAGRKVAISADGGRTRSREKKRGKKTPKGGNRFRQPGVNPSCLSSM